MAETFDELPVDLLRRIDNISIAFELQWEQAEKPRLEEYLQRIEPEGREPLFSELLHIEIKARRRRHEVPTIDEYTEHFAQFRRAIKDIFADCDTPPSHRLSESEEFSSISHSARSDVPRYDNLPSVAGYRLLRVLGRGAMGVVYLAQNEKLHRRVALKMVSLSASSKEARQRIRAEADLIARLQHPNIVQIFDVGEWDGETFLELEYVDGESLRDRLKRAPLSRREAVLMIECLARAMHYTHSHSVVHRDLKPANILIQRDAEDSATVAESHLADHSIKITDFGLAKFVGEAHQHTQSGSILGTPNYMSPEQAAGRSAEVGPATDVYALGAMLFEMLTGRPPFEADSTLELLRQITNVDVTFPDSIRENLPRDLQAVCLKCLQKEPERRYASAAELADDLRRYLDNFPVRARIPTRLESFAKFVRRNQWLVGGLAAIALTLVLGSVSTLVFAFGEAKQRQIAESNANRAQDNERAARHESYRARIALAVADVESHDVVDARRQLELAPAEYRGWEWHHLHSRLDDSVRKVEMPADHGLSMFAGPQGPRITVVTASNIRILDETIKDVFRLSSDQFPRVQFLGETEAGPWVISGDNLLSLLDVKGQVTSTIPFSTDVAPSLIVAFAINRDSTQVAIGGAHHPDLMLQKRFFVLNLKTGQTLGPFLDHEGRITGLAFSPDGSHLVSTSEDRTVRLWDLAHPSKPIVMTGHQLFVRHPLYRADGTRFLTCSADGTIRQWNAADGSDVGQPYDRHTGGIYSAAYSPDGEWIASTGEDRTIHIWKADGREVRAILHGHTNEVQSLSFSRDGRHLLSTSSDHSIRIWALDHQSNPENWKEHSSSVYPLSFSPDGTWLASGSWDHTIRLWDVASGSVLGVLPHTGVVRTLAVSADGTWLLSGCDTEHELYVWDVASRTIRQRIPGPEKTLRAVAIHPNGRSVAALDEQGSLLIADARTGQRIATAQLALPQLRGTLAYSPDGHSLAVACEGNQIGLWDTSAHRITRQWPAHQGCIYSLAFDSSGQRLVSGSQDGTSRVWNVRTGKCLAELQGASGEVFTAAFSPDGHRIVSGGRDRMVWVWDTATGQDLARLKGHTNFVFSLAFHPDGNLLVSGSGDGTLNLWHSKASVHPAGPKKPFP